MIEFLQLEFSPAVFVFSLLLAVVLLYWIVVAVGLVGTEFADVDLDAEVDAGGGDADAGLDGDGHLHGAGEGLGVLLAFFYIGRVPVTALATVLVFSAWIAAMLGNQAFNPDGSAGMGLAVAGGSLLVGLAAIKVIGYPFARLYRAMHANPGELRSVTVKGPGQCELYQFLTSPQTNEPFAGPITWNFEKFLVGRSGQVVARFAPKVKPQSPEVVAAIEAELAKSP